MVKLPRHVLFLWMLLVLVPENSMSAAEPNATQVAPGASVRLLDVRPELARAPKEDLATIELLIRPDADALARLRSFVLIFSNSGGADLVSVSLLMTKGRMIAAVLGTYLESKSRLKPDEWTHVALTINTGTVNKQAKLWIDGRLAADKLVLERWPASFQVAEMFSDRWKQDRVFTGAVGDVRFSRRVRYADSFEPPRTLPQDAETVIRFDGKQIPLVGQ